MVLMAASAVTAAVFPSISENNLDKFAAGSITNNSAVPNAGPASSITCAPDTFGSIQNACNASTIAPGSDTTTINTDSDTISPTEGNTTADG